MNCGLSMHKNQNRKLILTVLFYASKIIWISIIQIKGTYLSNAKANDNETIVLLIALSMKKINMHPINISKWGGS